ncbi:MAG TPA: hypothetical protein VMA31_07035 [Bryobacteraceae bacterium]|nr:hypothetical protein [Bryobacteraceae bacterium]
MVTITVEAILGILFAVVLMSLFKRHTPPPQAGVPQPDLANLRPTDARTGDVVSIAGAGDNMSDLDFTSDRTIQYQAGARSWMETSGMYRERRVAMRVENEDDVEVWLNSGARKLSLEDLGLSEEDLAEIDERQNPADTFEFDNSVWSYRQSAEANARRDDQMQAQQFYYWEFREQNGKRLLAVRKPQGEPFAVALYAQVPTADITIYRRT